MAFTQGVLGGLAAGQRFAESGQRVQAETQRLDFDKKQARAKEIQTSIDGVAKSLSGIRDEFAKKRAVAPTAEDQAAIDEQFGLIADDLLKQASRASEFAFESGVPVDPQLEIAKLTPLKTLPDLNVEARFGAKEAGLKAGAQEQAQLSAQTQEQPLKGAKPFIDQQTGETVFLTESGEIVRGGQLGKLPSTQIQIEGGLQPEPPPEAPTGEQLGQGAQIMQDIRESVGLAAGISKGISQVGGQFAPGVNPKLLQKQRINLWNQNVKFALGRNPDHPVREIEKLERDFSIDPDAMFVDPEAEALKIPQMKSWLINLNEADRLSMPLQSEKGQKKTLDRMGVRQSVLSLIGDVEPLPQQGEEVDIRIDALEQKGLDNLTPAELDELEQLLQ